MRQLGILEGSDIFGDKVEITADPYRTSDGQLKSKTEKAILWYIQEHSLSLRSAGTWPKLFFGTEDGQEQPVEIEEIVSDYEARHWRNKNA